MSEDDKFSHRTFLNDDDTMLGAVLSNAEMIDMGDKTRPYMSGQIQIGDCFRAVSLDFDVWDQADVTAALNKLDRLQNAVERMREFVNKNADTFPEKQDFNK